MHASLRHLQFRVLDIAVRDALKDMFMEGMAEHLHRLSRRTQVAVPSPTSAGSGAALAPHRCRSDPERGAAADVELWPVGKTLRRRERHGRSKESALPSPASASTGTALLRRRRSDPDRRMAADPLPVGEPNPFAACGASPAEEEAIGAPPRRQNSGVYEDELCGSSEDDGEVMLRH